MWSAVVVVKNIQTGEEVKRISGFNGVNRIDLENKILETVNSEINSKKDYYVTYINSPIGIFNSDPTGWEMYNMQKRGLLG